MISIERRTTPASARSSARMRPDETRVVVRDLGLDLRLRELG
ncbi:MAG: hypothetical protein WKF76_10320 [Nocardioidaceae bacterium]